jgi:hypothetical protein
MKKKYAAQTRNLMKWERQQAHANYLKGFYKGIKVEAPVYIAIGAIGVGVIYALLVWLMK